MLNRLALLVGIRDALTRASQGRDRDRFVRLFCRSTLFFLCLPQRLAAGLPVGTSQQDILMQVEEAARDLSENHGFQPFSYQRERLRRLPVFSAQELAAEFAKSYALDIQRIIPFQVLGVYGSTLVPALEDCDMVVLNDRTRHEYVLSSDDTERLRRACALTRS